MSSVEQYVEDVFETFKRYDVLLKPHVELILRRLGFCCIRTIANLPQDLTNIENDVRNVLVKEGLSTQELKDLLGETFYDKPNQFKFLSGELVSLSCASETAKDLLASYRTSYLYEKATLSRKRTANVNARCNTSPERSSEHQGNSQRQSRQFIFASKKRKTLFEFTERWMSGTKLQLAYTMNDCEFDNENSKISCKLCPRVKQFQASLDDAGCWKINTFVNHLKAAHLKKNLVVLQEDAAIRDVVVASNSRLSTSESNASTSESSDPSPNKQPRIEETPGSSSERVFY